MLLPGGRAKIPEITAPMFDVSDAHAGVLEQPLRLVARDLIHGIAKSGHGFLSSAGKVAITHAAACSARLTGLLSSRDATAPPFTQPAVRW